MPPGRRGRPPGSSNASRNPQQRISFGPNSTNKITKPSSLGPNAQKKASPRQKKQLERVIDDSSHKSASEEEETVREEQTNEPKALPIRQSEAEDVKTASQVSDARDKREEEASKISEAQIRKYWIHKEESRIAPRVHQQGLDVNEKVLREFDLSSQYGPCIGIQRMKRWKRAEGLGLKPPLEVLAVLLKDGERSKANYDVQRAYVDELMRGRLGTVEA